MYLILEYERHKEFTDPSCRPNGLLAPVRKHRDIFRVGLDPARASTGDRRIFKLLRTFAFKTSRLRLSEQQLLSFNVREIDGMRWWIYIERSMVP